MNKKVLVTLIVILAVVVVIAVALKGGKRGGQQAGNNKQSADLSKPAPKERVVKQEAAATLAAFPQGFPVEEAAQTSDSFKYVPANSTEQQSTVEYVSLKSLAENGKSFKDFMDKNGYKISNKVEQDNLLFYYGSKDSNDLSVKIQSAEGKVTVSASFLKR